MIVMDEIGLIGISAFLLFAQDVVLQVINLLMKKYVR